MQGFTTNLVIFIIMGCGWYLKRVGKLTPPGLKDINGLLFSLLMPIGFFKAGLAFNPDSLHGWHFALVLLGAYVVSLAAAWIVSGQQKISRRRRAVSMLTGARPNVIFIGLPVMTLWLGAAGTEAMLIYVAVCTPFFNVMPLICAQLALTGSFEPAAVKNAVVKTLKNPILIAGISGILIAAFGWTHFIPKWTMQTLKVLADCSNGLALIVIGASLMPERLASDIKTAWPDLLMKLFIHPAIIMAAFLLFPMKNSPVLMQVAVVASSISPAFNCYILAEGLGMDGEYAALNIAASTMLAMLTSLFWMEMSLRFLV
ncbi:MAG: AEC family transporter [Pyramidobacter sp.]|nr:AEC family transporter [Pyramidobacter sp.]